MFESRRDRREPLSRKEINVKQTIRSQSVFSVPDGKTQVTISCDESFTCYLMVPLMVPTEYPAYQTGHNGDHAYMVVINHLHPSYKVMISTSTRIRVSMVWS